MVSNVIMSLPRLQTLRCDQLSQAAMTFVAWHPSLTELDISIPGDHPHTFSQFPHPTLPQILPFSRIESFGMNSIHLTAITRFIQEARPSPYHLRITTSEWASPRDLQNFFSTLSNQRRHETLQSLRVQSYPYPTGNRPIPVQTINIDDIKPLLRFSKLRKLYLLTTTNFYLLDKELSTMGASWPCLEVINFNNGDSMDDPTITLCGLMLLVNKCPRLRSAYLAINTNALEGIEGCPASMVGANDLQHLVIAKSTAENSRAFALIVSLAFPKVKKIVAGSMWRIIDDERDSEHQWGKVNEYLEVFRLFQEGRWRT
ncbi:hypothetical protein DFH29DRAFT_886934 [Suillus ampliporus]|nr:hypothetical protein DFH29DRAFT_886934 [Suillus ampliporus]